MTQSMEYGGKALECIGKRKFASDLSDKEAGPTETKMTVSINKAVFTTSTCSVTRKKWL